MRFVPALVLAIAAGCATTASSSTSTSPQKLDAQACSPLVPAVARQGADVYPTPDSNSPPIATLKPDTPVCASDTTQGFGLSRVKLADGRTGFVDENNLSF
ncbi:MAG TPA: hypothetical protein VFL36_02390 [Myxococcales bacterium]|nr:hypothetical protein [Myxococcales bacterium]